jgi:hypothetical protein
MGTVPAFEDKESFTVTQRYLNKNMIYGVPYHTNIINFRVSF